MVLLVESCKHEVKVNKVTWNKPNDDLFKLNTDESALENLGSIGGSSILRDKHGNSVYAFATSLSYGTNNQAGIRVTIFDVSWCIKHGYNKIILEVDSNIFIKPLRHNVKPPWRIQYNLQKL